MESSEVRRRNRILNKQTRRKERAEKVEKERRATVGEDDLDDPILHPPRPLKKPRKNKPRKPVAEEDIVEGFAILAYKSFEDLTRALKLAEGESTERKACVQLLKTSSQEGGGDSQTGNGAGDKKKEKSAKSPRTKSSTIKSKLKENMVNKSPGPDNRCSSLSTGGSPQPPLKKARTNGPSLKEPLRKILCGESDDTTGDKVSDGFSDLFAPPRKDSSPHLLDNLLSSNEEKGAEAGGKNHFQHEINSTSPTTGTLAVSPVDIESTEPILPVSYLTGPLPPSNSISTATGDTNGHGKPSPPPPNPVKENLITKPRAPQTLFTPYAVEYTRVWTGTQECATTRVNTPIGPSSSQSSLAGTDPPNRNDQSPQPILPRNTHQGTFDFTLSGSQIHQSSSSPSVERTGNGLGVAKPKHTSSRSSAPFPSRSSHSSSGKLTPTTSSKSTAFGSIARLLDSPTTSTSRSNSSLSATQGRPITSQSPTSHLPHPPREHNSLNAPQSFASRSLSPRGHSPSRERESYSSNVSTLSRTSVTPVSGSSSQQHIPPNLSSIQSLSYAKAASWLSSVPPGLSPVPRPPPPGPLIYPIPGGHHPSGPPSLPLTSSHSPQSGYPGLGSSGPHGILPQHSSSAMFAPPILPLSSILPHPASQSSPFCPSAESIFHGASSSEMVRRDLESRFLSADRSHGGSSSFMTRPGEIHPHHAGLPGVNHLQSHNPGGHNSSQPPHPSTIFPPPMFKDMPKVGLDSPFYRGAALGMSYPFNGILQPPNLATPFTTPSQLPTFTPKKSGRWNAMHVRIAWEIYQHQQKAGEGKGSIAGKNSLNPSSSQALTAPTSSALVNSEFLRQQTNQVFPGMSRPPEVGPPSFASPLLSPHLPPPHRPPFDPQHSMFLHSGPLGPPLSRYAGFGGLGPSFPGLNSLGSSLLSRDLSSLASLGSAQDQWLRMQRLQGPLYPAIAPPGMSWPVQRPERTRTPTEPRRHKEERQEKRQDTSHSDSKGGRDSSPFRDRSPIRSSRTTPLENGDTDSRSSRSSDSHSTVQTPSSKFSRLKEEANGERNRTPTLTDRESYLHANPGALNDNKNPANYLPVGHPARAGMFHPASPMTTSINSGWDSFPGVSSGPRMSSAESFRLTLLQLSEREREFARIPQHQQLRVPLFNGPFMNLPMGMGGNVGMLPGSISSNGNVNLKTGPPVGAIPHLNPSIPPASMGAISHGHHHSSQNGPNSPHKTDLEPLNASRAKEEPR